MERLWVSSPSWLMKLLAVFAFILPTNALYFYMDSHNPKCFTEELPKDTLVVGHYATEVYNQQTSTYTPNDQIGILVTVDETFDNYHRVVSQRAPANGRFTFTAADSGEHQICFHPLNAPAAGGWLSSGHPAGAIKFSLDLAVGATSDIDSKDKGKIDEMVQKVRDLNARMQDIRREQVFQRERESEFRDQSEAVNSRVVKWTIIQLVVLGVTCAWQLSHLRAFFIKQKLT